MRWRCAALAGILVAAAAAGVRADPAEYQGLPVAAVRLDVEGRPGADRLLDVLETPPGAPLSLAAVRESIAHLVSLGFENVVVHAEAHGDGVALRYALTPPHPIERIVVEGGTGPGIDRGRLRRAVQDRFGASVPAVRAGEMAEFVAAELRARGYQRARVSTRTELRHAPDYAVLALVVDPGPRTVIGTIEVAGAAGPAPPGLVPALSVVSGDAYEPDVLAARIEEYLAGRRRRGHFEARVTLTARFRDDDRTVDLTVAATDGPRVRLVFAGDGLASGVRDTLAPIAAEGSVDEDLLEDSTNRIEDYLRRQGYRDAVAPYARDGTPAEQVITFTIRRGPLYELAGVELSGHRSVPEADLRRVARLEPGRPFVQADLDAAAAAVEDVYRRLGFAAVAVAADVSSGGTASASGRRPVVARLTITENVRTSVRAIRFEGNEALPEQTLLEGLGLRPGGPLLLGQMALDRDALQVRYANLGFPSAAVSVVPEFSEDGTAADILFVVREGPRLVVEHVLIAGNTRTRAETIARELRLGPGDPLGAAAIVESQQRLAALALFRRIRITAASHGDETRRDLIVTVEEAPATTVGYGGGVEVSPRTRSGDEGAEERLEFRPRAFFEIGRRNLFGKNRSVSLFTRLSLRSDEVPVAAGLPSRSASRFGFAEYRVLGTFREPRVFGTQADAFLTATAEQQIRPSFKFARRALDLEAARALTRTTTVGGNYQIQRTRLFDDVINEEEARLIDRVFPQVRLSSFSVSAVRDTRDDQLSPTLGHYASVDTQLAARRVGSEVGFVRSFVTTQLFREVPRGRGVVLAASARMGLASGFPREVVRRDASGQVVAGLDGAPVVDVVEDLPASERFFAGGDTTVRGFALDQLGTPATIDQEGFPIGGNALAIFNAELRLPVAGGLGLVGFFDVGNVFARTTDLDFGQLRSAVGVGVRYASPVGPLRIDLGFKTDRREIAAGRRENLTALHISLGQAF